jgi:TonB family protein
LKLWHNHLLLLFLICCILWQPSRARSAVQATSVMEGTYENSLVGLQSQVNDVIRTSQAGDPAALQSALDSFTIPNADDWIGAHFGPGDLPNAKSDYHTLLDKFRSHISWLLGNYGKLSGFAISIEPSRLPAPPAHSGPEAEFAKPTTPIPFENFNLRPSLPEDVHVVFGSFFYLDGHFRYVGYGFPFWQDGLYGLRMKTFRQMTAKVIRSVDPQYPTVAKADHIRGAVELHYVISTDGLAHYIRAVSGPPVLQEAAIQALRQWHFRPAELGGMPDDEDAHTILKFH